MTQTLKSVVKDVMLFCLQLFVGEKKLKEFRHKKYLKKKAELIRKYGPVALDKFHKIATEEKCEYWLFWGSLLGAYRDKGFIAHDDDIDIGMFDTDISINLVEKMIANGFKVIWTIVDKDFVGGYHLACTYEGMKFDIYSFHKDAKRGVNIAFCPLPYNDTIVRENASVTDIMHLEVECWEHLDLIPFEGIETYIPCNADKVLRAVYGKDYMTPIVDKKAQDENSENKIIEKHSEHYACMMNYEVFKMLKTASLI